VVSLLYFSIKKVSLCTIHFHYYYTHSDSLHEGELCTTEDNNSLKTETTSRTSSTTSAHKSRLPSTISRSSSRLSSTSSEHIPRLSRSYADGEFRLSSTGSDHAVQKSKDYDSVDNDDIYADMSGDSTSPEHEEESSLRYQVPRKTRSQSVDHSLLSRVCERYENHASISTQQHEINSHQHQQRGNRDELYGVTPTTAKRKTNEINFMDLKIVVPLGSDFQLDANQFILRIKTSECSCVVEGITQQQINAGMESDYTTMHSAASVSRHPDFRRNKSMSFDGDSPRSPLKARSKSINVVSEDQHLQIDEDENVGDIEGSRSGSNRTAISKFRKHSASSVFPVRKYSASSVSPVKPPRRKSACVNSVFTQQDFLFRNNDNNNNNNNILDKKRSESVENICTEDTLL